MSCIETIASSCMRSVTGVIAARRPSRRRESRRSECDIDLNVSLPRFEHALEGGSLQPLSGGVWEVWV